MSNWDRRTNPKNGDLRMANWDRRTNPKNGDLRMDLMKIESLDNEEGIHTNAKWMLDTRTQM